MNEENLAKQEESVKKQEAMRRGMVFDFCVNFFNSAFSIF